MTRPHVLDYSAPARPSGLGHLESLVVLVLALAHLVGGDPAAVQAPRALSADEGWVNDVVFPDSESIVLLGCDGPAWVSKDRGRTWSSHALSTYSCDTTIDSSGTIWSLYTWRGMDPKPQLEHSGDGGRTWSALAYPAPARAIPVDFASVVGDEAVLLDQRGQCWRHRAGAQESLESWTKLGAPNPDHAGERGLVRGDSIYVASATDVWKSADGGTSWISTGWLANVAAFALVPSSKPGELERVAAATDDGTLYVVELGKQSWKKLGRIDGGAQVFDLAVSNDGIGACGRLGARALAGFMDWKGRWIALEGVQDQPTSAIRRAPDGRVWIVGHGAYVCDVHAKRCVRVWPR